MVERLISEGRLEALDKQNIPNWTELLSSNLNKSFDPGNVYSLPYMNGTINPIVNAIIVGIKNIGKYLLIAFSIIVSFRFLKMGRKRLTTYTPYYLSPVLMTCACISMSQYFMSC